MRTLLISICLLSMQASVAAQDTTSDAGLQDIEASDAPAGAPADNDVNAGDTPPTKGPFDGLEETLDGLLARKALKKAKVGIHVVDLGSGETIYAHNADTSLNPASNVKLVTAAAVLDEHGTAFTFRTELKGARKGKDIPENLYLRGDGDPFLHWNHLLEMAERLRRKGIRKVQGDLVVDDSAFDDAFLPPAFDQKTEQAPYRATTAAVSANFSAMTVIVRSGKVGKKPKISFDPPNEYAIIVNRATTVKSKKEVKAEPLKMDIKSADGRTRIIISGRIRPGGATLRKRVHGPSIYAGYLMKSALESLGIELLGKVRRGTTPKNATLLAGHTSHATPLLVGLMQKYSNNFMAEMLFKSLDLGEEPATWAGATEKLKGFLDKVGIDRADYRLTNGSGLYDANALTARQITTVLTYMTRRADLWPEYSASFATAGVDGTLRGRMSGSDAAKVARAKTGTLNNVSAISGYVTTKSGRRVAYSILVNGPGGPWAHRQAQDKIITAIAAY